MRQRPPTPYSLIKNHLTISRECEKNNSKIVILIQKVYFCDNSLPSGYRKYSFKMSYDEADIETDLHYIQELPKHSSVKPTVVYTHITPKATRRIVSPLDRIVNQWSDNLCYH
ncbi:MAG TPA: hypothetical protein DEO70_06600 [Bacteroidales bacterium]|nr:MAG: hypothetical protein A2X11_08640 [Bacteroidetes bacterium GWE2_42_24]OFY31851.1 MAG: hypothetical protein A2X09_09735 [Bacteroidetes bacterium GWF2_43_11]HBZ66489.1 hypothetical protein [Bacteroidales bacterium]